MMPLALDLETSAQLLNVEPNSLEELLQEKEIVGIRIGNEWRVSIFVLCKILNTSADEFLEYLEDLCLAERIEEVESEPSYTPEEGIQEYQKILSESE